MAHLLQFGANRIGSIQRIGARRLPDGQGGRRFAVVLRLYVILLGPQFRPSHIPDPDDGPILIGADGNRGKLLGRLEQILDDDGGVQTLPFHGRRSAELARRKPRTL